MNERKLIAIVGATASGKTALGIELAQRLSGEIIGADSRQVYRGMNVGTAKPTRKEHAPARHHLIDNVDPDEPFSLGCWLDLAKEALEDIWWRGKQPLLVGGTGQYVWALLEGWRVPQVQRQAGLREELASRPPSSLAEELRAVDPEAHEFIDPRNVRRVVRALEVYLATGRPFSYWRRKEPPVFNALMIGLQVERDELFRRIEQRVNAMIEDGLEDEVRTLVDAGYSRELPSMSGIGYREMAEYLAGRTDRQTAIAGIKTRTHRLARHQRAWFKAGDTRIRWIDSGDGATAKASTLAQEFLGRAAVVGGP